MITPKQIEAAARALCSFVTPCPGEHACHEEADRFVLQAILAVTVPIIIAVPLLLYFNPHVFPFWFGRPG